MNFQFIETAISVFMNAYGFSSSKTFENHPTVIEGEKCVIPAYPDVLSRVKAGSPLADKDRSRADNLPAKTLDTQSLGLRVPTVSRTAAAFLMSHNQSPFSIDFTLTKE